MKTLSISVNESNENRNHGPLVKKASLRPRRRRIMLTTMAVLGLCSIIVVILNISTNGTIINSIGTQLKENFTDKNSLINKLWTPELHSSGRFTSVLVIGLDTREVYYDGEKFIPLVSKVDGDMNTDTIMQIIYDYENNNVFMVSIPRDLGVDVSTDCLEYHGRINGVYDLANQNDCEGGGLRTLSTTVGDITGVQVDYYAIITLDAFEKIIDTVGETDSYGNRGLYIDIDNDLYEAYPNEYNGYDQIFFPAGRQFLISEDALKYARSRQQTSDFDRAKRQQKVIRAVREQLLSSATLTNPSKLYDLVQILRQDTKFSEVSVNDIRAALILADDISNDRMYSIVLDPEFGGSNEYIKKYVSRPYAYYYMSPISWQECGDGNAFCKVREHLGSIYDNPSLLNNNTAAN